TDEAVRNVFGVTETTASGLLELTRSQNVYLAEIAGNTRPLRGGVVPPAPFAGVSAPVAASGAINIVQHIHVSPPAGMSHGEAHELGWQIGQGSGERISRQLGPITTRAMGWVSFRPSPVGQFS